MSEPLQYVYTVTRRARRDDPGEIEEGAYRVEDNHVVLYDREGKIILGKREIIAPFNAHETSKKMLGKRPIKARSFDRPLRYQPMKY